jgi:hypothetical protein
MTFWIILVFAIALSIISLRYRNLFFSLGGTLGWLGLWAYNNINPPTGVTRGSFVHEVLMYGSIIMAIGVMIMYLRNRQRGYTGYVMTKKEETEAEGQRIPRRGLMDLSPEEYQRYIRNRMRRRRQ